MSKERHRWLALVAVLILIVPMLLACGSPKPAPGPAASGAEPEATTVQRQEPTAAPPPSSGGDTDNAMSRVASSLGLLLGSGTEDDTPVLPSCHLELTSVWPGWDEDAGEVYIYTTSIQAEMQGKNVHFSYSDTRTVGGQTEKASEGEAILDAEGDKGYEVVDGQAEESFFVELNWVMWPLQPVIILSVASLGATPAGTEAVDGRPAEVYAVDTAKADPAVLAGVQAFVAKGIKQAKGKVWVDQATGAMLKADIAFEEDLYDTENDEVVGHESGRFELLVTQVGKATVEVPAGD